MKEVDLKDDQLNYHVGEYIGGMIKRGGDGVNEQPRKNGLRYFTILSFIIAKRKLTLISFLYSFDPLPHNNKQLHLN